MEKTLGGITVVIKGGCSSDVIIIVIFRSGSGISSGSSRSRQDLCRRFITKRQTVSFILLNAFSNITLLSANRDYN